MMDTGPFRLRDGCLLTLQYFGVFRYPLTLQEIHQFNRSSASLEEVRATLNELLMEAEIFRSGNYYLIRDEETWVPWREKGNERAFRLLGRSGKFVSIIASFPFVRGIAISGSLSKFFASENPDIDYFIVTAPNRLWIARTLLHLFKKFTFLTGHQHYFCMNYFVDTLALEISHPNIYSAIEVVTLLPVFNETVIMEFYRANGWSAEYLPNHPGIRNMDYLVKERPRPVKRILEGMMRFCFPDRLNRALMKLTDRKWRRKWRKKGFPQEDYDQAFLTELHISKNHPVDYQKKVLKSMSEYQKQAQDSV